MSVWAAFEAGGVDEMEVEVAGGASVRGAEAVFTGASSFNKGAV